MKRVTSLLFIIIASLIFCISTGLAQDAQKETVFDEMVVTATRTQQNLGDVPGRVEVITKEEIQQYAGSASKVDDILRYLSGITVIRGNGIYSLGASATLRGLSNEGARTLVLIDRVPINKSDTGKVNFNRINLNDIERIEIFKGPTSSLYGNNAMGGVINIITKKPDQRVNGTIGAFYGAFDTYGGNLDLSARFPAGESGFYMKASGQSLLSDGYISTPRENRTRHTVKKFVQEDIIGFRTGYDFDRLNTIELKVDLFDDKRGEGTKIFANNGIHRDFDTMAYSLRYQGASGNMKWQGKAFWQNENYRRVSERLRGTSYTRFDVDSDRTDMGIDGSFSVQAFTNHLLTVGGDIREGQIDGSDIYKTSRDRADNEGRLRIYGLWFQDEMSFLKEKLFVTGSVRLDYAKFFDGNFLSTIRPFDQPYSCIKIT